MLVSLFLICIHLKIYINYPFMNFNKYFIHIYWKERRKKNVAISSIEVKYTRRDLQSKNYNGLCFLHIFIKTFIINAFYNLKSMVIFRPSVHVSGVVCRGLPVSIIRVWAEELKKERQLTTRVRPSPPFTADYVGCLWKYYWLYFDFKLFTKPKKVLNICIFFLRSNLTFSSRVCEVWTSFNVIYTP